MTTLKRIFDLETRTLKSKDRCYVGQVYDHISTKLEFSYNPINALTDGMYTAYIMFDLYDEEGNIFVFGPGSSPRFDGRTFEIPTSITSRITTQRLDYQIWLIKNRTEWNGRIEELGDTEYLFSAKDSLAFKPTTRCRSPTKDPCRPPQPCLEPGTLGWVNYLRDHAVLTPFVETYGTLEDGTEGVTIHIPTYNEDRDQDLVLHIPYLDSEGLIDIHTFLRVVEEYNPDVTHDQIMTALCVQNLLDEKLDKTSVIDSWKAITEGGVEAPSAELAYRTFETKLDKTSVIDDWNEVDEDLDIASARLTKATLDEKADKLFPIPAWLPDVAYADSATVTANQNVYISLKDNNINHDPTDKEWWSTVTEFDTTVDTWNVDAVPWEEYANNSGRSPSARLVRKHPIADWVKGISYDEGSIVLHNHVLFVSMADYNLGHEPYLRSQSETEHMSREMSWWLPIRGQGSEDGMDCSTLYDIIGGPTEIDEPTQMYAYDVFHHFNTRNLFVTARTYDPTGANRSYIFDALYDMTDPKKVRVLTKEPLPLNSVIVYITPGGGRDGDKIYETLQPVFEKGLPGGYAGLDNKGKVPLVNLPIADAWRDSTDTVPSSDLVLESLTTKADVQNFGKWNPLITYDQNAAVLYEGDLYLSRQTINQNVEPGTDERFWINMDPVSYRVARKTILFGNSTDTEYVLNHKLGTLNFVYSVRRTDEEREYIQPRVFAKDLNNVRVVLSEAPGVNGVVLNIMDCTVRADMSDLNIVPVTEPSVSWVFDNTSGFPAMVYTYSSDGNMIIGDIVEPEVGGFTPITVGFNRPVSGNMVVAKADLMVPLDASDVIIDLAANGLDPDAYYLVQVYEGVSGQGMTEIIQKPGSGKIEVHINDVNADGIPDMAGFIILKKATMMKTFTLEETTVTIIHGFDRPVGAQVFQENGEVSGTSISITDGAASAYTRGYAGYMVIL